MSSDENKSVAIERKLRGKVVSDAMNKTIVVSVDTRTQHPLYKKIITKTNKFCAHDEENKCVVGDEVIIKESRPISKRKTWVVVEVLESRS